jgi:hypothetical protein
MRVGDLIMWTYEEYIRIKVRHYQISKYQTDMHNFIQFNLIQFNG